jgi:hypothetical protein
MSTWEGVDGFLMPTLTSSDPDSGTDRPMITYQQSYPVPQSGTVINYPVVPMTSSME